MALFFLFFDNINSFKMEKNLIISGLYSFLVQFASLAHGLLLFNAQQILLNLKIAFTGFGHTIGHPLQLAGQRGWTCVFGT